MELEHAAISIAPANRWRLALSAVPAVMLVASALLILSQFTEIRHPGKPVFLEVTLVAPPNTHGLSQIPHRAAPTISARLRSAAVHHPFAHPAPHHRRYTARTLRSEHSRINRVPVVVGSADTRSSLSNLKPGPSEHESGKANDGILAAIGAHVIYAPMPELPPGLSDTSIKTMAVARFDIAPDGSAEVALVRATANPRLNYLLLQALRRWRFFPAVKNGKPVASQVELRIPVTIQ
jgi:protein TonB